MNVVGYARISRDEDNQNYSSILTQCDIIHDYASLQGWEVSKIYIDDNVSGYTFNRPEFSKILQGLEDRSIDIIIAKDLSRIGRHNAKTLLLLDKVREQGKRMILVEEGSSGYDTDNDDDDIIGIKTWYNERYVKDISRKIRSNIRSKQKNGKILFHSYYGYKKDVKDKTKLIVDPLIAPIIQFIFRCYLDGNGYRNIAKMLNSKGYPTPSMVVAKQYEETWGKPYKNTVNAQWETYMVGRIISDDVYTGILRCNKRQRATIKGKAKKVNESEQFVFEDHHEAIISKFDFQMAQNMRERRNNSSLKGQKKYHYIFSGYILCGDCGKGCLGRIVKKNRRNGEQRGYECGAFNRYGNMACSSHAITENILLRYLKEYLIFLKDEKEDYMKSIDITGNSTSSDDAICKLRKELEYNNRELRLLLNQKIKDILKENDDEIRAIIDDSYNQLENEKKYMIKTINERLSDLQNKSDKSEKTQNTSALHYFDEIINSKELDSRVLEAVVERIIIYKNKTVFFELKTSIDDIGFTPILGNGTI